MTRRRTFLSATGVTLFSQHYLFVKFSLRTNTRKWQWPEISRMQVYRYCNHDPIEAVAAKTHTLQPLSAFGE